MRYKMVVNEKTQDKQFIDTYYYDDKTKAVEQLQKHYYDAVFEYDNYYTNALTIKYIQDNDFKDGKFKAHMVIILIDGKTRSVDYIIKEVGE